MQTDGFIMTGFLWIHEAMRRDTQRLAAACRVATSEDELRALGRWFARFEQQLDEHHRAEDDLYFPTLCARDASLAADLEGLAEDHHELVALVEAVRGAFATLDRGAIVARTAQLASLLDRHLAAEEVLVVPATVALMTAEEQRALEDGLRKKSRISQIAFALPWILTAVPDAARTDLMRELPLPLRLLQKAFWQRSYARLAAPLALADRRAA